MADVVVVGAGVVGASIAYHAARAGASVRLIDKSLPASGVTGDSFAWIGGPSGGDVADASAALRTSVLADFQRLEQELPDLQVRWTGSLRWTNSFAMDERQLAADEQVVDAREVHRLEPALRVPPARALHKTGDGAVDPVGMTEMLVSAARRHGAEVMLGMVVTGLRPQGARVVAVETSSGVVPAGTVVLAAGIDVPVLCASLGVRLPVAPLPALLLRITAPAGVVRTIVSSPEIEVREASDGHLLVAATHNGEHTNTELARTAHEVRHRLTATFTVDVAAVGAIEARVGMRPMPADGLPVIGPLAGIDGVYVAVMHSAVTLAPVVGRVVASEVVDGARAEELRGLRPTRFHRTAADE